MSCATPETTAPRHFDGVQTSGPESNRRHTVGTRQAGYSCRTRTESQTCPPWLPSNRCPVIVTTGSVVTHPDSVPPAASRGVAFSRYQPHTRVSALPELQGRGTASGALLGHGGECPATVKPKQSQPCHHSAHRGPCLIAETCVAACWNGVARGRYSHSRHPALRVVKERFGIAGVYSPLPAPATWPPAACPSSAGCPDGTSHNNAQPFPERVR